MKFKLKKGWRKTIIIAETESDEEHRGFRDQVPNREIRMVSNKVVFRHRIRKIHPDLLGLLCMVMFYPFCKHKVTFPKPVSRRFAEAFSLNNLPLKEMIDGTYQSSRAIDITNIDPNIEPYSGKRLSISYGGGFDSLAVHLLFPEAVLIHESWERPDGTIKPDGASKFLSTLKKEGHEVYDIINNQRYCLTKPMDWTTWPGSAANAILLATDLNIGYIMTGDTIDSRFLNYHGRYYPAAQPDRLNPWNKAFKMIGLDFFSPVWGISEVATIKIVASNGKFDNAIYCDKNNGYPCHHCFKCFRKNVYASALGIRSFTKEYWENYNHEDLRKRLYAKPLHGANSFAFGLRHFKHIDWIYEAVKDLPDTNDWVLKNYREAFKIMPPEMVHSIEERISRYCEPVEDPSVIENWDVMKNVQTNN